MRLNSAFLAFIALKVVVSTSSSSGTDKSTPSSMTMTKVANEDVGGLLLLTDDAAGGAGGADTDDSTAESRGIEERDRDGDVSVSGGAIESPEPRNLVDMIIPADDADEEAAVGVTRHLTVVGRHTGTAVGLQATKESYASTNVDVKAGLIAGLHGGAASATGISKSLRSTTAIASAVSESSRSDSNEIEAVAPSSGTRHLTVAQMSVFVQLGEDIDGEATGDESGSSVAMSSDGKTVAIGAPYNNGNGDSSGHVRVYHYDDASSNWVQIGDDIDGKAAEDKSGWSVAMSSDGKTVAIGAPYNDGNGDSSGHVRVYTYNETLEIPAWIQIGDDIDAEATGDHSGWSVAMSSDGKTVAIGACYNDGNGSNSGHVRVYTYNETLEIPAWIQIGDDIDAEAVRDKSGYSVAMSSDGKTVAMGAPYNNDNGSSSGHVRVYTYNETLDNPAWVQIGNDIDGEAANDNSGWSVAMSSDGKTVAIGAKGNDGNGSFFIGHVRVYTYDETLANPAWVQIGDDIDGEAASDHSGWSVAMSSDGKTVAIGTIYNDDRSGHVRVYRYDDASSIWVQIGNNIDGEAAEDESGYSLAMSSDGKTMAIGARYNDGNGDSSGHVRVFQVVCDNKCVLKALYDATSGYDWSVKLYWNFDDPLSDPCSTSQAWYGVTCTDGKVSGITLDWNNLVGSIPNEIGLLTTLAELDLHSNKISGPIPTAIGLLTTLAKLDLHSNEISGPIPTEIETLISLSYLDLDGNQLTGPIPEVLGALGSLTDLYLSFNQLTGTLPPQLGALNALTHLRISNNRIEEWTETPATGISGTIPTEFGSLTNLYSLHLNNNQLAGPIPAQIGKLTSLVHDLNLSSNLLSGPIPIEFGSLMSLSKLLLHNNKLSGPIPPVLGTLTSLVELDLHRNQLTGTIPTEIGEMMSLTGLHLSFNQLTGPLPVLGLGSGSVLVQIGQDIEPEDTFGYFDESGKSVAMSSDGKTVAIGDSRYYTGYSGHVRVYMYNETLENPAWVQIGDAIGGPSSDHSGWSVAMSSNGKTVAIGDPFLGGQVQVYTHDETLQNPAWVQIGDDIDGDFAADQSGYSVAMSSDGKTLAIGAPFDSSYYNKCNGGRLRVYTHDETLDNPAWVQIGDDIYGEAENDRSGWAVAISSNGKTVATGDKSRQVRVYTYDETLDNPAWVQIGDAIWGSLSIDDFGSCFDIHGGSSRDDSGLSVAMSSNGKTVAIGAPSRVEYTFSGHVRVYTYDETLKYPAWVQIGNRIHGNSISGEAADDHSGWSVAMSSDGKTVAIGADFNGDTGPYSGYVRVYSYDDANSIWVNIGDDIDGEADYDQSGRSVAMSSDGKTVAIRASYNDDNGFKRENVRVFQVCNDKCVLKALYDATSGGGWTFNTNWNFDNPLSDPCSIFLPWYGITCTDTDNKVSVISLAENNLVGSIPNEIGLLTSLTELHLSFNQLTGTLPVQLGALKALTRLSISDTGDTGIAGPIPIEFGELSNLDDLQLQNNGLTGTIPGVLAAIDIEVCGNQLDSYPEECPSSSQSSSPLVDTDNDGVPDYMDQCPDEGGFIHADGCPVDSDNDGVKDCVSTIEDAQCHSTTEITTISDLDSCCNIERDNCPDDTPRGATVHAESKTINDETIQPGCTSDTDQDGVYDGLDRCPDTTANDLAMINASATMDLDEQGCVALSPQMWEPTFVEEATVVSKTNGITNLDLLFTVDKVLYNFTKARADLALVDSQVMDASCINAFDDLTDTDALVEGLSSSVTENAQQGSYTGEVSADAVPVMVGIEFDISKLIGSTLWTEEPNGIASIDFCLKLSVLSYANALDATTSEVVTYENIKTSILLDMEQDFSVIGTKIKLDEAIAAEATIDVEYPLEACRCGDGDACVDSESILSQGEALKVCIRFAPDAESDLPPDFVKMTDVKSFTCSQNSVSMQPIDDFARQGVEGQLTSVKTINEELETGGSYTQDDRMLIVTTQLLGSFFGPQELPVDCSGTVVYEFEAGSGVLANESASQRLLMQTFVALTPKQSLRRVAEDVTAEAEAESESESEFSINIMLAKAKTENGRGIGGNRGAIAGIAIAGVVIAGVAVASVSAVVGVGATAAGGAAAAGSFGSAISSVVAKLFGTPTAAPPAPAAPVQGQPLAEMNEVGGQEVTGAVA